MKRISCTLLCILFVFAGYSQIGVFKSVISDTVKAKDYRFQQLPNYSVYGGLTNITTSGYDLTTPPGTTAQRPIVPGGKYILRYNTDSSALEIGNPSQVWKTLGMSSIQYFDTSSVPNFGLKVKSLFTGTSPILYNGVSGNFSIQQSGSGQAGYLSQADWVAFNAKLPDPGSSGFLVRTAPGIVASRQFIAASPNISIVNATGISGNPSIDLNDTLSLDEVILNKISTNGASADSFLFLNRSTNLLEVRPAPGGIPTFVANRAIISNGSGSLTNSTVTSTELGYLAGVTSSLQTQLDSKQPTGNYITGLTGDVTGTGPGSTTATIASGAVTYAKIQNVTPSRLLGRFSTSSGSAQEISFSPSSLALNSTTGQLTALNLSNAALTATGGFTHNWKLNMLRLDSMGEFRIQAEGTDIDANRNTQVYFRMRPFAGTRLSLVTTLRDRFNLDSITSGIFADWGFSKLLSGSPSNPSFVEVFPGTVIINAIDSLLLSALPVTTADTILALRSCPPPGCPLVGNYRTVVKIPASAIGGGSSYWTASGTNIYNNNTGNVGIGVTSPTSFLHIKAGTTTTASLGIDPGSLLTTPADGKMEYDGTNLYFTVGGTRSIVQLGTTTGTIYNTDGTVIGPRTVNVNHFNLIFDSVGLFRVREGDATVGGTYDFNNGVDHLVYDASNSSNLIMNAANGLTFQYTDAVADTVISSFTVSDSIKITGEVYVKDLDDGTSTDRMVTVNNGLIAKMPITNFANTDLTQTADRSYKGALHNLTMDSLNVTNILARGTAFNGNNRYCQIWMDPRGGQEISGDFMKYRSTISKADNTGDSSIQQLVFNNNSGLRLEATNSVLTGHDSKITVNTGSVKIQTDSIRISVPIAASSDSVYVPGIMGADNLQTMKKAAFSDLGLQRLLFSQTNTVTVTNTNTETTLVGTGVGSLTITPDKWVVGKTYRFTAYGVLGTDGTNPATTTFQAKLNSTTIAATSGLFQGTGTTGRNYTISMTFVCRATGSTGAVFSEGFYTDKNAAINLFDNGTFSTTVDMTTNQTFDFTILMNNTGAGNTVNTTIMTLEQLN